MDSFFDLFDEIDLAHINEILINPEENKKVYNIYKNLKESANLAIVASQVCEIKKRFVEQTGAALTRSGTNTQNNNTNNNINETRDQANINRGINRNPINNRPRNAAAVPGYARTGRGRGAGRGTGRGNHREGQIVNNSNVDRRQDIRNQVTQLANRQNPIFDIRNNQTARQIVFDSQYFEIVIQRRNERFQGRNTNYQVRFKNLPNDYQQLQDILFSCIDTLIKLTLSPNENSRTRLTIYHDDLETPIGFPLMKRQNHRNDNG